jgi:hypothetical protein
MKKSSLATILMAAVLSSCGAPLTEQQKINGTYLCRATKDRMIFTPNGEYRYSIGGGETVWHGSYCYDTPPDQRPAMDAHTEKLAREQYNYRGNGLRFTYALSGHCYPDGKPLWGDPYFKKPDMKTLIVTSLGKERHYLLQRNPQAEQDAPSNGGQRPSLNSGFPPRRG